MLTDCSITVRDHPLGYLSATLARTDHVQPIDVLLNDVPPQCESTGWCSSCDMLESLRTELVGVEAAHRAEVARHVRFHLANTDPALWIHPSISSFEGPTRHPTAFNLKLVYPGHRSCKCTTTANLAACSTLTVDPRGLSPAFEHPVKGWWGDTPTYCAVGGDCGTCAVAQSLREQIDAVGCTCKTALLERLRDTDTAEWLSPASTEFQNTCRSKHAFAFEIAIGEHNEMYDPSSAPATA